MDEDQARADAFRPARADARRDGRRADAPRDGDAHPAGPGGVSPAEPWVAPDGALGDERSVAGAFPADTAHAEVPPWAADEGEETENAAVTGAAYGTLFVLGVVFGVVSGLEHSWGVGDLVPPVPIALSLLLFGLLYTAGRLMGSKLGAFVPGAGWMLAALAFAVERAEGDLIVAATPAGYWYLCGGAIALVAAVLLIPSSGSWLLRPPPFSGARPVR
ncbi:hypothetical protein Sme01_13340 [Sphaerisporangium melleum]|uniref:Integral membrane protein n=1 Tax=Sphaerisporangium melleum TaxID=321316 RepID=A0A917QTP8_9ACTN|nr:DUF6113 family protein [Sphaerisporangium melleum]GGK68162.1 hypothetical protein GCM10007964_08940 [Sphaerisporangium melleum]GII68858.1 hypothetical protein Sme01_13340 [Sphaerisporangium melleum]